MKSKRRRSCSQQARGYKCKSNAKKQLAREAPAAPKPNSMSMSDSESDNEVENGVQPYDDAVEEESDDDALLDESDSASASENENLEKEDEPNEASQIVSAVTSSKTPEQEKTLLPSAPAPSPVAAKETETRRVCFRSPKGGPNKTTEVVIPQERIVHGKNAIAQPATDSDMEDWLCWKKPMHCFTNDFRTGILSSKSIVAVRFQEGENDSFVVLGFVAEAKEGFYFVPLSNTTAAALMEDPNRFFQSAQIARDVQNNQAVYDRAKKKPFPDRTKLARKMLDAIKTEESVWKAVPQPKAPRKPSASRSKAPKNEGAATPPKTDAVWAKDASELPKKDTVASDEDNDEVSSSKKAKVGGSRRMPSLGSEEPKSKQMKQSTLLQAPKAKEQRTADTESSQVQRALEDDVALLPEPSNPPELQEQSDASGRCASQSSTKRTKSDSASSDATRVPEQQHRNSHRKRPKAIPGAQDPKPRHVDSAVWNVDLPLLATSDSNQTGVLCRAEWQEGQSGALQVVVTQHFSIPIPDGFELAKAGVFVKTSAEPEAAPFTIAVRPA